MKIVFEGEDYELGALNDLLQNYSEGSKLIQFIHKWQGDRSNFQFQTSGSTGIPKVIEVSRNQITASVTATTKYLGLKKSHQTLLCLDPNFVASLMMAARCLVNDMDMILIRPSASPLKSIEHKVDFASFVPLQIYKMIEDGIVDQLININNILIGGAPLTRSAFETLAKVDTNIFVTYGMTETLSHIALMPAKGSFSDAYYEVLEGVSIGQDQEQCLSISGAVTNNQLLQTNDIVEIIDANKFRWLGRRDHVINSGGIKIHPEQMERLLEAYIKTDFIISWKPNEQLGSECLLIIEGYELTEDEFEEIQQLITQEFSKYYIPKTAISINKFERTLSGKVKREETRQKAIRLV